MTPLCLTPRCRWHWVVWLRNANDTAKSDSAMSVTLGTVALLQRFQTPRSFFAYVNISAKSKPCAKIIQHMNNGPRTQDGLESWKKLCSKESWHWLFRGTWSCWYYDWEMFKLSKIDNVCPPSPPPYSLRVREEEEEEGGGSLLKVLQE